MAENSAKPGADTAQNGASARMAHDFPKSVRLRKRSEFLAVQQSGKRFHGRHFLAVVTRQRVVAGHEQALGRVGITVTKKVGNAVIRNRIKRLVREYVRQGCWLQVPVEAVIIAKHSAAELSGYAEIATDLAVIEDSVRAFSRGETPEPSPRRHRRPT